MGYNVDRPSPTFMKVSKCGGTPTTLSSGGPSSEAIAVNASGVYWPAFAVSEAGHQEAVMQVGLVGGTPTALIGTEQTNWEFGGGSVAVDEASVYETGVSLIQVPVGGGTPTTLASLQFASAVAVDATNVYFVSQRGTEVVRVPKGGGPLVTLATGQLIGQSGGGQTQGLLAVDATSVYWTNAGNNTVMKVGLDGGKPTTLASGQALLQNIVVDASNVYWLGNNSVMKVALAGGTPEVLASAFYAYGLAVDDTSLYWTTMGGGNVMKLTPK
jgi:hypothetical protein